MYCHEVVMAEKLKEIILDFQTVDFQTGVPRHVDAVHVPGKAMVCIGVRRSGKSTFMFQVMKRLLDSGINRQNILYLNFFDDRLHGLQHRDPGDIIEAYYSIYPEKKNAETVYCFFDEIQMIPGWEPFVDRLMRTEMCEVYITGSSARMLSKEIATQMRGRSLSWEIFPFSFKEYLDFKGIDGDGPLTTKNRLLIQKTFEEYWETGGFPEVAGHDRRIRVKIHQEYWGAMLFRDLIERHDIPHPRALTDLAYYLVDNTGSLYSINNLTNYLKSLGYKAPKSAVSDYLAWFEDAYILFTVRIYDASIKRSNANPKKIYCIDHALVTSVGSGILVNSGHLLENLVFVSLRRFTPDIYYYKTRAGREVDFIVNRNGDRGPLLVQVCESLADPNTRKREIAALSEAMAELNPAESIIVTRSDEERIQVEAGQIIVQPVWRFLMDAGMSV